MINVNKKTRLKTPMLRADLCDFSHAYILVKGDITFTKNANRGVIDIRNRSLAFKDNAPFIKCISKINSVQSDNAENLDVVLQMYNLLEYIKNSKKQ